jgi:hypothetical protein
MYSDCMVLDPMRLFHRNFCGEYLAGGLGLV